MLTKTFELRLVYEDTRNQYQCETEWEERITYCSSSSSSISLKFCIKRYPETTDKYFEIDYAPKNIRDSSWKEAVVIIRQHGKIIVEILFTLEYPNNALQRKVQVKHADPLQVFHVTIIKTYDDTAAGNRVVSALEGSSIHTSTGVLDSKPENHFDQPSELFNTALVIGESKVYVNNYFLAIHSPFFEKLFFGEFAEKDKSEIVLEDIDYDKFVEFLRVIHPDGKAVTNTNVEDVLFVANYVQCTDALKKCSCFLLKDESFSVLEKLRIADKYELTEVMDSILDMMTMDELQSSAKEGRGVFSILLKARICDKLVQ